jgi:hypothetical protein
MGHGIGMAAFEPPHLRARDDYVPEPGMPFSIVTRCGRDPRLPPY